LRRGALGLACLAALLSAAAISAAMISTTRAQHGEHLVVWHAYGESEARGLNAAIDAYRAEHPEVSIDVVASPFGAYATKLRQAIPAGNGPDLFIDAHDRLPSYVESGLL
jgi:arabinogalactan oligomer / maltooligosaccharide transport system permease protein